MTNLEELRFIAKVARLYYIGGMNQSAIARQLDISQATVSRLIKRAEAERIVRVTVSMPDGVYADLEEQLENYYKLQRAVIVDAHTDENDDALLRALGSAAAYYVESTIAPDEVIGISSWSATLLGMVEAITQQSKSFNARVVQILGGIGSPSAEVYAARITERLARALNGEAIFLPAPGVVQSQETRSILLQDYFVQEAFNLFDKVTLALVGIGDIQPSKLLASSGNVFASQELEYLQQAGAVGDICLSFFGHQGQPIQAPIEKVVIGMSLAQLSQVRRSVGIAGGERKYAAIRGAVKGGYINVLITDHITAKKLLSESQEG